MGALRDYVVSFVHEQVKKNRVVVWFDPEGWYPAMIEHFAIPDVAVAVYQGSFFALRHEVEPLMRGEDPPDLIVYVPMAEEDSFNALAELAAAGVVMKPGQSPWQRNTRPSIVAKRVVSEIGGEGMADAVEKQVEAGNLSFDDVDRMTDLSAGGWGDAMVVAVFQTTNPVDVALLLLSGKFDAEIAGRNCLQDIAIFLGKAYGADLWPCESVDDLRASLAQHAILAEFIASLGDVPPELEAMTIANHSDAIERQLDLVRQWRMRRDLRDVYSKHADRIESQLGLETMCLGQGQLESCLAFAVCDRMLQSALAQQLVETEKWTEALRDRIEQIAKTRLAGFWSEWPEKYPDIQPGWQIILSASDLLYRAYRIEQELSGVRMDPDEMAARYVGAEREDPWCLLDTAHRNVRQWWYAYDTGALRNSEAIGQLVMYAGRRYMEVGGALATAFVDSLEKAKFAFHVCSRQTDVYTRHVEPALAAGKAAYVLVDSLRYEMALELSRELAEEYDLTLSAAVATVPTITEIGMAALMPGAEHGVKIRPTKAKKLALEVDGAQLEDRRHRIDHLKGKVEGVYDDKLGSLLAPGKSARRSMEDAKLILITSDEIDTSCESANEWAARNTTRALLGELPRAIRTLRAAGCATIVVTADHGHLFLEELTSGMKIDAPGGETYDLRRRVWVGRGGMNSSNVCMRARLSAMGLDDGDLEIVVPRGFGAFKAAGGGESYFHGGMSLPEIMVPVLVLKPKAREGHDLPQDIAWNVTMGSAKITTRFLTVNIEADNTALLVSEPPRVLVEVEAAGKVISKTVGATYGFAESSGEIALRLKEGEQRQIDQNTVTLMLVSQPSEEHVSVCLRDAATGRILETIGEVEVDIAF
jgi:hypothetical protein